MEDVQLSTTMSVQRALYTGTMFCDYCCEAFHVEKMTIILNFDDKPQVLIPDFHCRRCGNRNLTDIDGDDY